MDDIILIVFSRPDVMLLCGLFCHLLKNYDTWRISSKDNSFKNYLSTNKVQHILSSFCAIAAYTGLAESSQLTAMAAFGIGWMCNSVADYVGKRTVDKL